MILAVDTETTGTDFFHGCRPFLIIACDGQTNYSFWGEVNPYTREVFWEDDTLSEVQELLDKAETIIFHNTQFDMRALESVGLQIEGWWDKIEDTLLASHALCSGDTHELKELAIKYLDYWNEDEEEVEVAVKQARVSARAKGWAIAKEGHEHFPGMKGAVSWWKQDMWLAEEEVEKYAHCDVERTFLLWYAFKTGLTQEALWAPYKLRKKLLRICYDISTTGMRLNLHAAENHIKQLERKMELIRLYIEQQLGIRYKFNWNKRDHLLLLLHTHLDIPVLHHTPSGSPAANKNAIKDYTETYKHPLLNALSKLRRHDTEHRYITSYIRWTDSEGYIHSNLNITGTRETRQSSTSPNQQNITPVLKRLFQPPPGHIWLEIDFANIELRIWAYAVGNEDLVESFEQGISIHRMIMEVLYPQELEMLIEQPKNLRLQSIYRRVKAGNFALIYGATVGKADETYGYSGATQKVFRRFPGIQEYTQSLIRECEENKTDFARFGVRVLGGYFLDVPSAEPFKASNYKTQGAAGIIMNHAMIAVTSCTRFIDSGSKLISQVHDSLKPQIPIHPGMKKTVDHIVHAMETCALDIFGKTPVDYEITYHPDDANNPHLQELLK